jgi:hypothetical protein
LYVTQAERHHVEILLTLALTPTWASARPTEQSAQSPGNAAEPKNIADWEDYVRTIATRYKGRIHYFEVWNEPNVKSFWSGSTPQLVELACSAYSIIKRVDPTAQVTSPPFGAKWGLIFFEAYLGAGGGKCADIIDYHLYVSPGPPEEMVGFIQQVKEIMTRNGAANKPLWNTESAWAIQNKQNIVPGNGYLGRVLSPDEAASYLARAFVLSWASGVSRFYWYSWDNYVSGLVDHDGKTLKSPAIAYGEIQKWLIGARMDSCDTDANGTWPCAISRDGGYRGWIIWNPNQTQKFELPRDWDARRMRDLRGSKREISPKAEIEIGPSPVLLESAGECDGAESSTQRGNVCTD